MVITTGKEREWRIMHKVLKYVPLKVTHVTSAHILWTKASHMAMFNIEVRKQLSPPCLKGDTWEHWGASMISTILIQTTTVWMSYNEPSKVLGGMIQVKFETKYLPISSGVNVHMWNNWWVRQCKLYTIDYNNMH